MTRHNAWLPSIILAVITASHAVHAATDCDNPVTSADMVICESVATERAERELTETYARILAGLRRVEASYTHDFPHQPHPALAGTFRLGQTEWRRYRAAACTLEKQLVSMGNPYRGDQAVIAEAGCLGRLTRSRIFDLQEFERNGGLKTPEPPAPPETIWLLCDARASWLQIPESVDGKPPVSPDGRKVTKTQIGWGPLVRFGKQNDPPGSMLRTGSRVATKRCGELSIRVSYGYLGDDPDTDYGAIVFAIIEIRRGRQTIVTPTNFYVCEMHFRIYGQCPNDWATSIIVERQPRQKRTRAVLLRSYSEVNNETSHREEEILRPDLDSPRRK